MGGRGVYLKNSASVPVMYKNKAKQRQCEERRKRLIVKATKSELIFKKRLIDLGIRFIFQKGFIKGNGFYIVDFYLPRPHKIAIEIDGKIHNRPDIYLKDFRKNEYLRWRKIKVLRIKNEDVSTIDIINAIENCFY